MSWTGVDWTAEYPRFLVDLTGDGRADIDRADIVMGSDNDMRIAAFLDLPDGSDIGDDACEHESVLDREREAF